MIKLGLISPSSILINRFLPAVSSIKKIKIAAISVPSENEWDGKLSSERKKSQLNKAKKIKDQYDCKIYYSHEDLILDANVDCVYISTPPSLHFRFMDLSLENGKNIFVEKPICLKNEHFNKLKKKAKINNLVFHENYMFSFHKRISNLKEHFKSSVDDVRSVNIKFTFPHRGKKDFRYNLGISGGAIFDTAGYVIKLAQILSDYDLSLEYSSIDKVYGGVILFKDSKGIIYNCHFGMDHDYRCELEIQLRNSTIYLPRIFTVRPDEEAEIIIKSSGKITSSKIFLDDSFKNSFNYFIKLSKDNLLFEKSLNESEKTLNFLTSLYEK